jgi:hypothetical protein
MNKQEQYIVKQLHKAWNDVRVGIGRMHQSSVVKPVDAFQIFSLEGAGPAEVKFTIKPIVFNVPERANSRDLKLYIAIAGWLSFTGQEDPNGPVKTASFGTKVGYFRSKKGALQHVYGVHYDIDETTPGHPVLHGQISPQMEFGGDVLTLFHVDGHLEDLVNPILRNVRTPTAQMDVFSVITQICADHLIFADSGKEVREAFVGLRKACGFFVGVANRLAYLNSEPAISCYRSTHWYAAPPRVPVSVAAQHSRRN